METSGFLHTVYSYTEMYTENIVSYVRVHCVRWLLLYSASSMGGPAGTDYVKSRTLTLQ